MGIPWERCCWEQSTCFHSRQCLSEQNIIRNRDNIGQYGNRLPVGDPWVCSALGRHARSIWRRGNTEKQQDKLSALTGGSQEDLLKRMYGAFSFSVTETENSLPLMAYGRMQTICNLTCMFICGFLLFPSLLLNF